MDVTCSADAIFMDTLVSVVLVHPEAADCRDAVARAFARFEEVERRCSRFDPGSELARACAQTGRAIPLSATVFEPLSFAMQLAAETEGAFDPTVGRDLERRGFNTNYRTGISLPAVSSGSDSGSYGDVELDREARTVALRRPLGLDLGAVAKGFAVDLAAAELAGFGGVVIDAGGDLSVRGRAASGRPWQVGVRHPRRIDEVLGTLTLDRGAVCTSGDYERFGPSPGVGHHILDPRRGRCASDLASVTVLAASAMEADGLATAAFVLGWEAGRRLLERRGCEGIFVSRSNDCLVTKGLREPGWARAAA